MDSVQLVSSILKKDGLINDNRLIKHKHTKQKRPGFWASRLRKQIYYFGDCSSLSNEEMMFCLLHEESHLKDPQNGNKFAMIYFLFVIPMIIVSISMMINESMRSLHNITIVFVLLALILINRVLFTNWLMKDEIQADRNASLQLKKIYGFQTPSIIVGKVLEKVEQKVIKNTLPDRIYQKILSTHPSNDKRVEFVRNFVDLEKQ